MVSLLSLTRVQLVGDLDVDAAKAAEGGAHVVAGTSINVVAFPHLCSLDHRGNDRDEERQGCVEDPVLLQPFGVEICLYRVAPKTEAAVARVARAAAAEVVLPGILGALTALSMTAMMTMTAALMSLALSLTPTFTFSHVVIDVLQ